MKAIIADPMKCTGCRTCELICSFFKEGECNPSKSRISVFKNEELGLDFPIACLHCETPACMEACPTGAIAKRDDGLVVVDRDRCTGCGMCARACPFNAIKIDPEKRKALVCDLCGGTPKCVEWCSTGAIKLGDITDDFLKREKSYIVLLFRR
jgi:Fe-S-cluster-containing dehydrogenase component